MDRNTIGHDHEKFEDDCRKMISKVLLVCEAELSRCNEHEKTLSRAAMAVRESLLTFLSLICPK